MTGGVVIQEPFGRAHPTRQLESNVASSSTHPTVGWQTIFRLGNEPFPMTASVRTWAQGKGARVTRSLGYGLQLSEDVHLFSGGVDESLSSWLQWHTIAVMHFSFLLIHG